MNNYPNMQSQNMNIPENVLAQMQGNTSPTANVSSNAVYQQPNQMSNMGVNPQMNGNSQMNTDNVNSNANKNSTSNTKSTDVNRVRQMAANDIQIIQNLIKSGIVAKEQGQNLMQFVVKKAFDSISKNVPTSTSQNSASNQNTQGSNYLENLENPQYFEKEGRNQVLDYLKQSNANFDKDEMSKIVSMIDVIEETAISNYLKQQDHEKTLNNENETAKQRLRANAQKSGNASTEKVFTRDEIGKMSGKEFALNEKSIMEQLSKGMIR
ncbi:MAG: hypothetical protein R3Y28_07800 [Candidatus Gastranaerophilales bacterium]